MFMIVRTHVDLLFLKCSQEKSADPYFSIIKTVFLVTFSITGKISYDMPNA